MSTTTITSKSYTSIKSSPIGGTVTAVLNFYKPPEDGSKPFNYVEQPPKGQPQRNFGEESHPVVIEDIRGREQNFNLDRDAFQTITNISSSETAFDDDDHIKSVYYPECEQLILSHVPGAYKVIIFDHTIRRSDPNAKRSPVTRSHVDQTAQSTISRVKLHSPSPESAESLLQSRYRIINIWRPINGTVESHPLAFASADSVSESDLIPVEHRYPNRTGETAQINYNENMKWYYYSSMGNQDRLLLKCWDSQNGEDINPSVPHTAFVDPNTPEGAKGRESIEVRALVFG